MLQNFVLSLLLLLSFPKASSSQPTQSTTSLPTPTPTNFPTPSPSYMHRPKIFNIRVEAADGGSAIAVSGLINVTWQSSGLIDSPIFLYICNDMVTTCKVTHHSTP